MSIDYDKFGHCSICHKNMLIEEIIDNRPQQRFTAEYCEAEFLLSDKSKMRVAMCTICKSNLIEEQHDSIMQTVINGWGEQVKGLDWEEEKKQAYMDRYSQLNIVTNSENVPQDILETKFSEFSKVKEVKNVNY